MSNPEEVPQPMRNGAGATDPGPRNVAVDRWNPDLIHPPATDSGTLPNLKWPYSLSHNRLEPGGWARQTTMRELPAATALAGVNMRLNPGAVREPHWHKEAEWAYMLVGRARITAVDQNGQSFADDVGVGDLWYFPPGIPHSIQGLAEGCEFLLVFDDGNFSEDSTFLVTDLLAHLPPEVVAANLGLSVAELAPLPKKERYIFQAELPPLRVAQDRMGADLNSFAVSERISAALVEVNPGGMREVHWHPDSDEWQYYIAGQGRMTVFASSGTARTFDYQAGDVGYVPLSMPHYVQNTGTEILRFLEVFASGYYSDVSLNQWLALTPPELVQQTLQLDAHGLRGLKKIKQHVL